MKVVDLDPATTGIVRELEPEIALDGSKTAEGVADAIKGAEVANATDDVEEGDDEAEDVPDTCPAAATTVDAS